MPSATIVGKPYALEEKRQHEHRDTGVPLLSDGGAAEGNHARQVQQEGVRRPDEAHEERTREAVH